MERFFKFLRSPSAALLGAMIGLCAGVFSPALSAALAPFGKLFLSLLKMCALPIMMTAVLTSFARLMRTGHAMQFLWRIFGVFLFGVGITGAVGLVCGALLSHTLLSDPVILSGISKLVTVVESPTSSESPTLWAFVLGAVPTNIFDSLARGEVIGVILFSVLIGTAIGLNRTSAGAFLLSGFEGLSQALFQIMSWILYLLPLGLASLISQSFSTLGADTLAIFGKLILGGGMGLLALFLIQTLIIYVASGYDRNALRCVRRGPLLVALSTQSSLASLPALTVSLQSGLKMRKWVANLVAPLGITFCQHATVYFYTAVAVLVTYGYKLPFGPAEMFLIVLGAFLQAFAGAGLPGLASLSMLTAIFSPLGLPMETVLVILLAVQPICDPILTVVNVNGYAASAALIRRWVGEVPDEVEGQNLDLLVGFPAASTSPVNTHPAGTDDQIEA